MNVGDGCLEKEYGLKKSECGGGEMSARERFFFERHRLGTISAGERPTTD